MPSRRNSRFRCFVLLLPAVIGCSCGDGSNGRPGPDATTTGDATIGDAGGSDGGDAGLAAFCVGSGPIVLLPGQDVGPSCTGGLAQTTFRYAVCSCGPFVVSNTFTTDSFDSTAGPYSSETSGRAGAFGTNGSITLGAAANVGGSVWVAGANGIAAPTIAGALTAAGELRTNGPITSQAAVTVGRDAFVGGALVAASLLVTGTLTQPAGATRTVSGTTSLGGTATAAVSVPDPCACEQDDLIDVAGLVAAHASANDDVAAGFDPAILDGYAGPVTIDLPCGRLYAPKLAGTGPLVLRVAHRTALFLGGDLAPSGDFTVELVGGGELDLFVEGDVVSAQRIDLGSVDAPSRVRLYVGGDQPIALSGGAAFAGNVYAPRALFTMSTAVTIYGSLFAAGVFASDRLTVHYDAAILHAGDVCGPPPDTCTRCADCGNQACTAGGTCGACVTSADCCSPLICAQGTCLPEPSIE